MVPDSLQAALTALLPRLGGGALSGLTRLSGGATQEIWRFEVDGTPLILRRARGGNGDTGIGLATEASLIVEARSSGVPVPEIRLMLGTADGLGNGFIMECVDGETLGSRIVRSPPPWLARQCGRILAKLHTIDPQDFPELDRLTPAQLVEQWRAVYRAADWPRPVFEVALRWLDAHCPPPPQRPVLVHGDFRNGNLMVGANGVRAVLDWELAHVGDGLEDLGWLCVNSWRFGRSELPVGGFGTIDDLIAGYGAPVDRAALHWWEIFGTLRWGCMCAGMAAAFRTSDPSVERAMIARRTSETEIDLLRLLGD